MRTATWIPAIHVHIGGPQLTLTSEPQTSGTYCPGPVTFTCVGTQIGGGLFWRVNGSTVAMYRFQDTIQYPFHLAVNPPLDSVTAVVTTVSINYNTFQINITSQLRAGDVTVLNGAALQCESILQSNVLRIEVGNTSKFIIQKRTNLCRFCWF